MSQSVERSSPIRRTIAGVVMLCVFVGAALYAYWDASYVSSLIERASAENSFEDDPYAWDSLVDIADDARAQQIFRAEIQAMAARPVTPADTTAVRDRLWMFAWALKLADDDDALFADLAALQAKFGTRNSDVRVQLQSLIPDLETNARVAAAMLDHAVDFAAAASWNDDESSHMQRLLREIEVRDAGDDPRLVAAAATMLLQVGSGSPLQRAASAIVENDATGAAAPLAAALVAAAERGQVLDAATFEQVGVLILAQPPAADEAYIRALAHHCTGAAGDICLDLAEALGADGLERLRTIAGEDEQLAAFVALIDMYHGGDSSERRLALIDAVARGLAEGGRWPANTKNTGSRMAAELAPSRQRERAVAAFMAMDDDVLPFLTDLYLAYDNRAVANLCARVLAARQPGGLAAAVEARIAELVPLARRFVRGGGRPSEAYFHAGDSVAEGLRALADSDDTAILKVPFFATLSLPDTAFSDFALVVLRDRLEADPFTDGMFQAVARRDDITPEDLERFGAALASYADGSPAIARNLATLLEAAGGNPQ
ncbi:MAG: hypothetical protein QGF53_03865, partial [Alphaproteobacteria bacterium]|nr:hypothetical protein [Alphaproteobacteria bacterium]